ncbi:plasmid maintenance protein CcdB (plasmid) [Lelliottia sp. WB101]|jgi:toxin CcdB|uniref:CcdB family protein n=1 Tax=Lelliottia sp. WB101 TaxID=2153385 RepID=UPI000D21FB1E|nr:CcdB family protein [Lelliottia sp. WB101]AVZ00377.1 plasmid maintenance protein CcdB [Lelliottia sp. WB101]
MAQFDIYRNKGKGREHYPYFMVLQHDLFDELNTRIVVPLTPKANLLPTSGIHPGVNISGKNFTILTDLMTSIDSKRLDTEPVATASHLHSEIVNALDLLITGI